MASNDHTVIPFRPRGEVPRAISTFRGDPTETSSEHGTRLRVHGSVSVHQIIRAFRAAGCEWKQDAQTGELVAFSAQRQS